MDAFLEAFESLPQRVLWKYEDDTKRTLPANVRIMKWLPQRDVLGKEPQLRDVEKNYSWNMQGNCILVVMLTIIVYCVLSRISGSKDQHFGSKEKSGLYFRKIRLVIKIVYCCYTK